MICACEVPIQSLNRARNGDMCLRCGRQVLGDWVCDDDTVGEFFDRLGDAQGFNLDLDPAHPYEFFRRHCINRELAGRDRFKFQYLGKDNAVEGMEEAADGALYSALEELKDRRKKLHPSVHLMMAAMHFAKAHECLLRHKQERRGTPTYNVDE